ncbi:MAG: carboxypeptidase-like regulatory domain-containing protein [Nitrospirota bacterium]
MKRNILGFAVSLPLALFVFAGCAETHLSGNTQNLDSGIKGQVLIENQGAAEGVFVYAYDSPYNDLRVPTKLISAPTLKDGSYTLKLAPGTYYIVARRRTSGDPKGYLVKGDYEGKYPGNPVTVKPGAYETVNVSIAMLAGNFLLAPYLPEEGSMGLSGRVYDETGKPAVGAFVMIYKDREMVGLPTYLSKPTSKDGDYYVYLPKSGTYYVAARLRYGGLPRKGEPYGTYDKDSEHKVAVNEKEIVTGIDIRLGPFPFDLAKPAPPVVNPPAAAEPSAPPTPEPVKSAPQ